LLTDKKLFSAGGQRLHIIGTAKESIMIAGYELKHVFYVCDINEPILLGRTFMVESGASINLRNQTVTFNDILELPLETGIEQSSVARIAESVFLPGNAEVLCQITCHNKYNNKTIALTPIETNQFKRIAVGNSVSNVAQNKSWCRVMNCLPTAVVLSKGQRIAQIEQVSNDTSCLLINDKISKSNNKQWRKPSDKELDDF
jgi:hypothetical protein